MNNVVEWTTEVPRLIKLYMKAGKYGEGLISIEDEKKYEELINDFGDYAISAMQSQEGMIEMALDPVTDAANVKKITEIKEVLFSALKLTDYPEGI